MLDSHSDSLHTSLIRLSEFDDKELEKLIESVNTFELDGMKITPRTIPITNPIYDKFRDRAKAILAKRT